MSKHDFRVDFVGIGSGKCGSTWFYENLVQHPQICDGNLKELNYFSDLYEEHRFSWYESQYAGCEKGMFKGEFSVTYLPHPLAAERIKRHFPDAKIMAIIRDPVKRTFSNYLHSLRKGKLPTSVSFSEYIEDELNLSPARYSDHLDAYYRVFPKDRIKVIVLEEFLQDIPAGFRETYSFLGVDDIDYLAPAVQDRRNEAKSYRFLFIENLLVQAYYFLSRRGYTRIVKRIKDSGVGDLIRRINGKDVAVPQIDQVSEIKLREYFGPCNQRLSQLLGKDLSCWENSSSTQSRTHSSGKYHTLDDSKLIES